MQPRHQPQVKIVIIGSEGSGKTALFNQICRDQFLPGHVHETAHSYRNTLIGEGDNRTNLNIHQTVVSDYNKKESGLYYQNPDVVIIVYDQSDKKNARKKVEDNLATVKKWYGEPDHKYSIILVSNKSDLSKSENREEIANLANEQRCAALLEVSLRPANDEQGVFKREVEGVFGKAASLAKQNKLRAGSIEKTAIEKKLDQIWERPESDIKEKIIKSLELYTQSDTFMGQQRRPHVEEVRRILFQYKENDALTPGAVFKSLQQLNFPVNGTMAGIITYLDNKIPPTTNVETQHV